jgi:DNA-3-methyladenine glycosylase I
LTLLVAVSPAVGADAARRPAGEQVALLVGVRKYHPNELRDLPYAEADVEGLAKTLRAAGYREAFDGFEPAVVARYGQKQRARLLSNAGIVRNRLKIEAAVRNAQMVLAVQEEFGSFDQYVWRFVGHEPRQNAWRSVKEIPARTPESDAMSKDLKRRGFKFVGSTICYAFMQAVGLVNDHLFECFRHGELRPVARHGSD